MDVYVQGADDWTDKYDMMSLTFKFQHIFNDVLTKSSAEDQKYFHDNRRGEIMDIDGVTNMNSNTGIINYYTLGSTNEVIKKTLSAIKSFCESRDIELGQFKVESSNSRDSKVIRIPVVKNDNQYQGYPELNMANRNARVFFEDVLKLDIEENLDIGDVKKAIKNALQYDGHDVKTNAIVPSQDGNIHDSGLSIDQIKSYIRRLVDIIHWAEERNLRTIYVA